MAAQNPFPCGRISRRHMFHQSIGALLGGAVGALWAEDGKLSDARLPENQRKADAVIFLFMCGGVSHIDTFDPKGNKHAGKLIDAIGFGDNVAEMKRPVIPCLRTFKQYGQSGIPVSDWFPHVGGVIDDIAVVRSMWCQEGNHFPAVIETQTGHRGRAFDNPSFGSWVSYALGSGNKNLPTYVNVGRPSSPVQLTGGYLGATYAATPFQAGPIPIPNLKPPASSNATERDKQMEALLGLNQEFRDRHALNTDIAARVQSYELAARMQLTAPGVVDLSKEPKHVQDLYGIGEKATDDFGKQLLMARRLVESGVRFVQICHAGGGNGSWDAHGDMKTHEPLCRAVDKPIAGLINDLKQRGMLQRTLVVFTSEFGRSPWSQNTTAATTTPKASCPGSPAEASRAASSTAPPTSTATKRWNIRITTATCMRRSCDSLVWTTARCSFALSAASFTWSKKATARSTLSSRNVKCSRQGGFQVDCLPRHRMLKLQVLRVQEIPTVARQSR